MNYDLWKPQRTLVYSSDDFAAIAEGQANIIEGDQLYLMDDSDSYWWLVHVLKTREVGYVPGEIIETPFEHLARVNAQHNTMLVFYADAKIARDSRPGLHHAYSMSPVPIGVHSNQKNKRHRVHFNPVVSVVHRYLPALEEEDGEWNTDNFEDENLNLAAEQMSIQNIDEDELIYIQTIGEKKLNSRIVPDGSMHWDNLIVGRSLPSPGGQVSESPTTLAAQQQQQQFFLGKNVNADITSSKIGHGVEKTLMTIDAFHSELPEPLDSPVTDNLSNAEAVFHPKLTPAPSVHVWQSIYTHLSSSTSTLIGTSTAINFAPQESRPSTDESDIDPDSDVDGLCSTPVLVVHQSITSWASQTTLKNSFPDTHSERSTISPYSLASSRTTSTDYGHYYRRMALSQSSLDSHWSFQDNKIPEFDLPWTM